MSNAHAGKSPSESSFDARIDALCDEFEASWKRGDRPQLEDLLAKLDEPTRAAALQELLQVECEFRSRQGETFSRAEYLQRFTGHEAIVEEFFTSRESGQQETIAHTPSQAASGLHVRCPHCHNPIELVAEAELTSIDCPSCGHGFTISGGRALADGEPLETEFAHFELIERLGIGAFGSVWKAKDTKLDRIVAIKIPRKGQLTPKETESFLREARAAAQLKHPHIVSVHEIGREDERLFIVSDFVEGGSLADRLESGPLSSHEAAELCVKLAEALEHAHEQGVIHRDLKPANILLDDAGNPQIADFGLAKREAGEIAMTMEGQIIGTPAYMSPEQALGEGHQAEARSDIYSLGVVLYHLLTGEMPFRGNVRMLLKQVVEDEPPPLRRLNSNIPKDLETICLKCMEKQPQRRYDTARTLADDLQRFLRDEPIQARPISSVERGWRWCKRKPIVAGLSVAVAALLLGIAIAGPLLAVREANLRQRAEENAAKAKAAQHKAQLSKVKAKASEGKAVRSEAAMARAFEEEEKARQASEAVVKFISDSFGGRSDKRFRRSSFGIGGFLQSTAKRIPETLKDQPLTQAQTWLIIGKAIRDCYGQDLAHHHFTPDEVTPRLAFEKAYTTYTEIHGPDHPDTLRALTLFSSMPESRQARQHDWSQLKEVYARQQELLGKAHDDTISTLRLLLDRLDDGEKADYQQQLVELEMSKDGEQSERTLHMRRQLVKQLIEAKEYQEAFTLCRTLLPLHEQSFGRNHERTLELHCYYCMAADEEKATQALEEFLARLNDSEREHVWREVYFFHLLAGRMAEKGTTQSLILLLPHFAKAIDGNDAWDFVPTAFNDDGTSSGHPTFPSADLDAFNTKELVASISSKRGGLEEILMVRRKVAELYEKYRPQEGLARAHVELPLGQLLLQVGDYSDAVEVLTNAFEMTTAPFEAVINVAEADSKLSDTFEHNRAEESSFLRDPMEITDKILHLRWDCSLALSNAELKNGSPENAIEGLEQLVSSIEPLRPWSSRLVRAQSFLGYLYAEKGQSDEALEIMNTLVDRYILSVVEKRELDPSERSSGPYATPVFQEAIQQVTRALVGKAEINLVRSAFDSAVTQLLQFYPQLSISEGQAILLPIAHSIGHDGSRQQTIRWLGSFLEQAVKHVTSQPFEEPADADKDPLERESRILHYTALLIFDGQHKLAAEMLAPFAKKDYQSEVFEELPKWQQSQPYVELRILSYISIGQFLLGQALRESGEAATAEKAFGDSVALMKKINHNQSLAYQTALFFSDDISEAEYLDATKGLESELSNIWYTIGEHRRWNADIQGAIKAYSASMRAGDTEGADYRQAAWSFLRLRQLNAN